MALLRLAMTDGRWVCAGLDRNGLRPMRYVVTADGMLIAGSEAGMVPLDEARVVEKARLGRVSCWLWTCRKASCSAIPRSKTSCLLRSRLASGSARSTSWTTSWQGD